MLGQRREVTQIKIDSTQCFQRYLRLELRRESLSCHDRASLPL